MRTIGTKKSILSLTAPGPAIASSKQSIWILLAKQTNTPPPPVTKTQSTSASSPPCPPNSARTAPSLKSNSLGTLRTDGVTLLTR
ncbi:uncharacterized protein LDX57_000246 [Aspergillus melleus]|uniref:uncharacterized protein n=1 Tax=Aspergillus melleus TaxID=138277 RepID=UPI001E8E818B|nr:uncharacterized protein LDX57_000246 [Aspergillus melleus]KAH8422493.1 hypothetical protein LDX57_000246 [Aspergillus melleus]